jgi:hypothetical protein
MSHETYVGIGPSAESNENGESTERRTMMY